jgi:hypothetical protein
MLHSIAIGFERKLDDRLPIPSSKRN